MEDRNKDNEFPTNAFLHKDVLGVLDFIEETGCRGEGVTVAVIDTGVDPGAYGMRKTLDGRPKVVDTLDLTGDGDVEMGSEKECEFEVPEGGGKNDTRAVEATRNSAESRAPERKRKNDRKETKKTDASAKAKEKQSHEGMGYIVGVSGRKLWFSDGIRKMCPSGKFRIGAKSAFSFWPEVVIHQCKEKRKERWTLGWEAAYGAARRALDELEISIENAKDAGSEKEEQQDEDVRSEKEERKGEKDSKAKSHERAIKGAIINEKTQQDSSPVVPATGEDKGPVGKDQKSLESTKQHLEAAGEKGKEMRIRILEQWKKKREQQLRKRELENRLEMLECLKKEYDDPGPIFDCVTFYDGKTWKAIVDTAESGNLDEATILSTYREDHEYASFTDYDQLNYSVNIYDDGRLLSIVVATDDHGTGVAGHVGAYHPVQQEFDGMAPNCQIVSLKVWDRRLGVTAQAIIRALACITPSEEDDDLSHTQYHKVQDVDIVNFSLGGRADKPECGRMTCMIRELVQKHDIIFFAAAGNYGPSLSTVCAPGGVNEDIVSVGGYITKDLATQAYSPSPRAFDYFSYLGEPDESEDIPSEESRTGLKNTEHELRADHSKPSQSKNANKVSHQSGAGEGSMVPTKGSDGVNAVVWTSSSRGPSPHGLLGVSVCAPAAGYSPSPEWCLSSKDPGNGTSLAAPSCAGAVAVFISFLRLRSIRYSSYFLRKVIENSSKKLLSCGFGLDRLSSKQMNSKCCFDGANPEYSVGNGSIDLMSAKIYVEDVIANPLRLNFRRETTDSQKEDGFGNSDPTLHLELLRITVDVCIHPYDGNMEWKKGIYIRDLSFQSGQKPTNIEAQVYLTVCYDKHNDTVKERDILTDLEVRFSLTSTASWIRCPPTVLLMGSGQDFKATIDASTLREGTVNYAEIVGSIHSATEKSKRCLFKVPVTVILGEKILTPVQTLELYPGMVVRKFLSPPFGATYCSVWMKTAPDFDCQKPLVEGKKITLHCVQCKGVENLQPSSEYYFKDDFKLQPDNIYTRIFPIKGGELLEVCIAQEWDEYGKTVLEAVNYTFGGLSVSSSHLSITEMGKPECLTIRNNVSRAHTGREERNLSVAGGFTKIRKDKLPMKARVESLGIRDQLPKRHQTFTLKLEYEVKIESEGEVSFCNSGLNIRRYDSELCAVFMVLFNEDKKLVKAAEGENLICAGLKTGYYTVVSEIRHDDCEVLKKLKCMALSIIFRLESEIEATVYASEEGAILQDKGSDCFSRACLRYGDEERAWFGSEAGMEVQKSHHWVETGDILLGYFEVDSWPFASRQGFSYTELPRYDLSCAIRVASAPKSDGSSKDSSACSDDEESFAEQQTPVAEALEENDENNKIDYLDALIDRKSWSDFDEAYKTFSVDEMDPEKEFHLDLLLRKLRRHALEVSSLDTILAAAKDILKLESQASKIAGSIDLYPGFSGDSDKRKAHQRLMVQRDIIIEAHFRRIKALLSLGFDSDSSDSEASGSEISKYGEESVSTDTDRELVGKEEPATSSLSDSFEPNVSTLDDFWMALKRWIRVRKLGSIEGIQHGVSGKEWKELLLEREITRTRYATALKYIKEAEDREATEMRLKLLDKLGWTFEREWEVRRKFVRFPKKRVQF